MEKYSEFLEKFNGTQLPIVFNYTYYLFKEFPSFSGSPDSVFGTYCFILENSIILMGFKNQMDNKLYLYFFGAIVLVTDIDGGVKQFIDDAYSKIRILLLGLENPNVDGYSFNCLNINKSISEFIDEPKLNNLFYFYDYIPKKYISKANDFQNEIANRILHFKEHYIVTYSLIMKDINSKLKLLNKDKKYYVCSIPGHNMTDEQENNPFDSAINECGLPSNCIYIKNLIIRTKPVYKKAFGPHVYWEDEINSLGLSDYLQPEILGKTVIVLDDITTTGNSMQAVKFLLLIYGAKDIIFMAYGKTTHL